MKTAEIAELLSGDLRGAGDVEISGVASLKNASAQEITFLERPAGQIETRAGCVIVPRDSAVGSAVTIEVDEPKVAFAAIAAVLHPFPHALPGIHSSAIVSSDCRVAEDAHVGAYCVIEEGSEIGSSSQIHPGSKIGRNVT